MNNVANGTIVSVELRNLRTLIVTQNTLQNEKMRPCSLMEGGAV
jgi:hypothetical protein